MNFESLCMQHRDLDSVEDFLDSYLSGIRTGYGGIEIIREGS